MKAFPRLRPIVILLSVLLVVGILGYGLELSFPVGAPKLENTLTPITRTTAQEVGSYDVLGHPVAKDEVEQLLQSELGRSQLSSERRRL